MKRFADELARRLTERSQEYMELSRTMEEPERERLIARAVAFSEIADIMRVAARESF